MFKQSFWTSVLYSKKNTPWLSQRYNIIESNDMLILELFTRDKGNTMKWTAIQSGEKNSLVFQNLRTGEIIHTKINNKYFVDSLYGITHLAVDYFFRLFRVKQEKQAFTECDFNAPIEDKSFVVFNEPHRIRIKYTLGKRLIILERTMSFET